MAIDSAAKRKSIAAISLICIGPVVVPDGTLAQFDRQVVGYGYGGILAGAPAAATAEFVCLGSAEINTAAASGTLSVATSSASILNC